MSSYQASWLTIPPTRIKNGKKNKFRCADVRITGGIMPGAKAGITVIAPNHEWTYQAAKGFIY